ncbi:MAG: DNA polymerase III subunit gamma/tau [Oscillospiraceae bacterium]|nr:DNA polymerase III subunit gamma/tau [Oscillospiraceae bacterium]
MKTALYRKYRPRSFGEVLGQEAVAEALKNQIALSRYSHSYIFTGIRGTGKTTFARILAKAINCPNSKDGEPCNACDICHGIDEGEMLDISEIDAASNSGVDSMRELRDESAFAPNICKFRVYIIDEAHILSKEAWAALLKIMEEPPAHVIFILATTELHRVPATILSRCQRYELRRIPPSLIAKRLLEIAALENIDLKEDGAQLIARLADGAMRDALSLLDTCSSMGGEVDEKAVLRLAGLASRGYTDALLRALADGDIPKLLALLKELGESSADPVRVCYELLERLRDLLALKLAGSEALDLSPAALKELQALSSLFAAEEILTMLGALISLSDKLSYAPDRSLALELELLRMASQKLNLADEKKADMGIAPALTAAAPRAPAGEAETQKERPQPPETIGVAAPDAGERIFAAEAHEDAPPWEEPSVEDDIPLETEPFISIAQEPEADEGTDSQETAGEDDLYEHFLNAAEKPEPDPSPVPLEQSFPKAEEGGTVPAGLERFEGWEEVVESMRAASPLIYGCIRESAAYLDGKRLLIDGGDKFSLIASSRERLAEIERAVLESRGEKYRVEPYEPQKTPLAPKKSALDDILEKAKQKGITIDEITRESD